MDSPVSLWMYFLFLHILKRQTLNDFSAISFPFLIFSENLNSVSKQTSLIFVYRWQHYKV